MDSPSDTSRAQTPTTTAFPARATATATTEELLQSSTVGLVKLDDFRKRRFEALERKERQKADGSRSGTPATDDGSGTPAQRTSSPRPAIKKRKVVAKGKLSFGIDDDDHDDTSTSTPATVSRNTTRPATPLADAADTSGKESNDTPIIRRIGPNTTIPDVPRILTKSALAKESQTREQLRKEFLIMQEAVKATEIMLPFVFYDGTNIPGGMCRMKKGEHVWLFLDKAKKVGAESGVGGGEKGRREWARVSVDDLLMVRDEIIVPHHYDFYFFIAAKTLGFTGPLFPFSSTATLTTSSTADPLENYDPLSRPGKKTSSNKIPDAELEGYNDDPNITKVVDRRWYERNKHIFPASVWQEFDPKRDYTSGVRKDVEGNSYFFS